MLRITTEENTQALTLRLEGRFEGPWVAVLAECCQSAISKLRGRRLCVNLGGVTFVDPRGKAWLADIYRQGAELLAEDVETKAIIAEIRTDRAAAAGGTATQK